MSLLLHDFLVGLCSSLTPFIFFNIIKTAQARASLNVWLDSVRPPDASQEQKDIQYRLCCEMMEFEKESVKIRKIHRTS